MAISLAAQREGIPFPVIVEALIIMYWKTVILNKIWK
nr:spore germination protein [Alteribacillus bidgolensis]